MKLSTKETRKTFQNIADISAGLIIVNKPSEDQIKVAIVQKPFKSISSLLDIDHTFYLFHIGVIKMMKKMIILFNFL